MRDDSHELAGEPLEQFVSQAVDDPAELATLGQKFKRPTEQERERTSRMNEEVERERRRADRLVTELERLRALLEKQVPPSPDQ